MGVTDPPPATELLGPLGISHQVLEVAFCLWLFGVQRVVDLALRADRDSRSALRIR